MRRRNTHVFGEWGAVTRLGHIAIWGTLFAFAVINIYRRIYKSITLTLAVWGAYTLGPSFAACGTTLRAEADPALVRSQYTI